MENAKSDTKSETGILDGDIKEIITPNLMVFCLELQDLIQKGYEIHPEHPPVQWGVAYECKLVYNDRRAKDMAERVLKGRPKLSLEERMEKARAARKFGKDMESDAS